MTEQKKKKKKQPWKILNTCYKCGYETYRKRRMSKHKIQGCQTLKGV